MKQILEKTYIEQVDLPAPDKLKFDWNSAIHMYDTRPGYMRVYQIFNTPYLLKVVSEESNGPSIFGIRSHYVNSMEFQKATAKEIATVESIEQWRIPVDSIMAVWLGGHENMPLDEGMYMFNGDVYNINNVEETVDVIEHFRSINGVSECISVDTEVTLTATFNKKRK